MFNKIDVRDIVRDHFRTLTNYGTGRSALADYVLFLLIPALSAGAAAWTKVTLSDTALTVLVTAIAVLGGLLFNLLVLVHTVARRFKSSVGERDDMRFVSEIYSNVSYSILVSLLALVPLTLIPISLAGVIRVALNAVAILLSLHLLLTLLMLLKRLHALLSVDINSQRSRPGNGPKRSP